MTLEKLFHTLTQVMLPILAILSQGLIMFGRPDLGLLINLCSQPFWLYAGYKSYRYAGQTGLLIAIMVYMMVSIFAFINYSLLY